MKHMYNAIALLFSITLTGCQNINDNKNTKLEGPYLGQQPPSNTAKLFAPGLVSTSDWSDGGKFSPDMNEFYVTRWRVKDKKTEWFAVIYKKVGEQWQEFPDPDRTRLPTFSTDGNTKFFRHEYQVRTNNGWSEPKSLGPEFEKIRIMGISESNQGTLVLDEWARDGYGTLRYSRLVDGKREAPKPLDKSIFNGRWIGHPFIAPDESYILWDTELESGFGKKDLWISFKLQNGEWGQAINLGKKVNTEAEEGGPHITPDGKYLLFNRLVRAEGGKAQSDLYWIDTSFLEELKPSNAYSTAL